MARIKENFDDPRSEIIMYQGTVEALENNTLIKDYFVLLKKILNEGYVLKFKNDHESDNLTEIESVQHLKSYINDIQGYNFLE